MSYCWCQTCPSPLLLAAAGMRFSAFRALPLRTSRRGGQTLWWRAKILYIYCSAVWRQVLDDFGSSRRRWVAGPPVIHRFIVVPVRKDSPPLFSIVLDIIIWFLVFALGTLAAVVVDDRGGSFDVIRRLTHHFCVRPAYGLFLSFKKIRTSLLGPIPTTYHDDRRWILVARAGGGDALRKNAPLRTRGRFNLPGHDDPAAPRTARGRRMFSRSAGRDATATATATIGTPPPAAGSSPAPAR